MDTTSKHSTGIRGEGIRRTIRAKANANDGNQSFGKSASIFSSVLIQAFNSATI